MFCREERNFRTWLFLKFIIAIAIVYKSFSLLIDVHLAFLLIQQNVIAPPESCKLYRQVRTRPISGQHITVFRWRMPPIGILTKGFSKTAELRLHLLYCTFRLIVAEIWLLRLQESRETRKLNDNLSISCPFRLIQMI